MQIVSKEDITKISYKPWSHKYDIDISLIQRIELGKIRTKLIFEKGKERLFKTAALEILTTNNRNASYA